MELLVACNYQMYDVIASEVEYQMFEIKDEHFYLQTENERERERDRRLERERERNEEEEGERGKIGGEE